MTCQVNDEIDMEHGNYNDDWRKVKNCNMKHALMIIQLLVSKGIIIN